MVHILKWKFWDVTLNIKPGSKPIKQGMRCFNQEKHKAICEDLARLLAAGFKEVQHLDWIANPVLVPKKYGKWSMCVDYTSLNKACLKDLFPLPRIDQVVNLTAGCDLKSFLDAYSGYHQIPLVEAYQLATMFITPFGCFLLHENGVRTEERGGYIPAVYVVLLQRANRAQPQGLHQ
jgi:hypothetical protein